MPIGKRLLQVAALLGLSLGFACGQASIAFSQDAAAAVAAAQKAAQEALSSPSEWKGPTTGPKPIPGKRLAIITCALLTEGCNRPARAATEAAKKIGWVPTVFDGQADTGKQLAAINAAVDGKYDAIVMILIDPIQVNEGVQRAIAAKIPVVTLGQPFYTKERKALSQIPDISHDWLKTGELIGDYMIWKSDGKVDALLLDNPETTVVEYGQFAGTKGKLTDPKACPDCKVTVEDFTIAQINSQPAQLAAAAVQRDPKINWVWCYDFCLGERVDRSHCARFARPHIGGGLRLQRAEPCAHQGRQGAARLHRRSARLGGLGDRRHRQPADARAARRRSEHSGPVVRQEQPRRSDARGPQGRMARRDRLQIAL